MIKIMMLQEFLNKRQIDYDERSLGLIIITPKQTICVEQMDDEEKSKRHDDLINDVLSNMFDINKENYRYSKDLVDEINKIIPNGINNFIYATISVGDDYIIAQIFIPKYITKNQLCELLKINKEFKESNTETFSLISNYDPNLKTFKGGTQLFDSIYDSNINLDKAINYIISNKRIKEYEIKNENIVELNKSKKKR